MQEYVIWFEDLGMDDVERVGGKNASLGEMISHLTKADVLVPGGFATTAHAFWSFLDQSGLKKTINDKLDALDTDDIEALAKTGAEIRQLIVDEPFSAELNNTISSAYAKMMKDAGGEISVAVRSSATAEDLPDASFAGQQETFLNVNGIDSVLLAVKHVFASLYNDRAISYRVHQGFEHSQVALSAGIQRMVRSDIGAAGVMFTIDTESGFEDVVFITSSYGLGETVVQGAVNPDEFYVHKPALAVNKQAVLQRNLGSKLIKMTYNDSLEHGKSIQTVDVDEAESNKFSLTDDDVQQLAKQAVIIEKHYGRPMDIEWGKDGVDGKLYILQARPETVQSRSGQVIERYIIKSKGDVITTGRSIGQKIGAGKVRIVKDVSEMSKVEAGDILVTDMTDPDWEPVMKKAAAIVTNRGGRTCHAAIIARELGIPAVVGCGNATKLISDSIDVTVSCAEGDTGYIYNGILDFEQHQIELDSMPELPFKIMMNVGNPERAFDFQRLPNAGVGLARLEFIIAKMIGVHPKALLEFDKQSDELKEVISELIKYFKYEFTEEGMFLVEHLLLKPRTTFDYDLLGIGCMDVDSTFRVAFDNETQNGSEEFMTSCEEGCEISVFDPYSYRVSIVLPGYTYRFSNPDFRKYAETVIRQELPAHVLAKICWVGDRQGDTTAEGDLYDFEKVYKKYLIDKSGEDVVSLGESTRKLITALNNLNNIYPPGRLLDCEQDSSDDLNGKIILGQSNI